jgi:thiol-disulfide isomerase/thioredoxin
MRRMTVAGPPSKRPPHSGLVGFGLGLARFGTALLVLLCALSAAPAAEEEKMRLGEFIPVRPPQPAPATTFNDIDGRPASLADFKGTPVVVNLWATWCRPCLKEMPSLDRLQGSLAGRIVVAAVSEDRAGAPRVAPFAAGMGLRHLKIYLDPQSDLSHALHVRGLPTSVIIDAQGRMVGRVEGGAEWDSAAMLAVLKPLLEKSSTVLKGEAR